MGSLPRVAVLTGSRSSVPVAPLTKHLAQLATSERTALIYLEDETEVIISYSELEERTNALARTISCKARTPGTNRDGDFVIAVCMQPTHNTLMTLLAAWKAGAAYVPIDPSFPQARVTHILKDAEPALVIYDDSASRPMFVSSGIPMMSFQELSLECRNTSTQKLMETEMLAQLHNESIAIILYTSGSTGIPKGVRLSYSAICNRLWWQFRTFPYSDTEAICVWKTALTFVDAVCEIWGPLLNGRSLLILPRDVTRDPQRLTKVLSENKIERLVLVPTLLRSILMYLSLNRSERLLCNLKLWVCSGETLSKELVGQFFQYFGNYNGYTLANFYGSTEVMGDVTYYVLKSSEQLDMFSTVPIGIPLDNCAIYLLDEDMKLAKENESGEIWVAGANLASGYVGGQAPEKFCDNPHAGNIEFSRLYRTGDFGIIQKGMVLYAGRTDSQVKIRGNRVDLQEVDRAVAAVQGVEKSVVLCYGLDSGNPQILSFVTIEPQARTTAHHIEGELKSSLTSYMIPQVIVIESIPLLVNGKVDRQALLKMYETTNNNDDSEIPLEFDYTGVLAEDMDKAQILFETVGEVVGRSIRGILSIRVGFFELGGNSLNSIYTITRLRDKGYHIQISDFLRASNLGEVLTYLRTDADYEGERNEPQYTAESMKDDDKQRVIDMIVSSFYEKAELEQFLKHEIEPGDYAECIDACWPALLQAGLSIVLKDGTGTLVAVALNFDARDEPEIKLSGGLSKIMTFLEYVEGSVRDTMLPDGKGTVLHSFMMATAEDLNPWENVTAIRALEHSTMRVARERRFKGVFTTNTSPLTQQLGTDVLGFQTLLDYQLNEYVDDSGDRIFGKAPDDMRAVVCWKPVE